jgi:2-dehydro-3-deoxyphosphogluconate aldolase/(4S)-4-hydroxy-2-oxoglutarate aldolase
MNNSFSFDLFNQMPVIGIMRNFSQQQTENVAEIFYQSGLTCLEITMNSPDAIETISSLTGKYGNKLNIGAGTVCTMDDLEKALNANAQYIVTPIVNNEVIKTCAGQNIPIFPGAFTPTEIYSAWLSGATMVKVFPAGMMAPGYIKEILGPLNKVQLLPTGGVTFENFTGYLNDGAKGVGIGSHLFPKTIIENEDWEALRAIFSLFKTKYNEYLSKAAE